MPGFDLDGIVQPQHGAVPDPGMGDYPLDQNDGLFNGTWTARCYGRHSNAQSGPVLSGDLLRNNQPCYASFFGCSHTGSVLKIL